MKKYSLTLLIYRRIPLQLSELNFRKMMGHCGKLLIPQNKSF